MCVWPVFDGNVGSDIFLSCWRLTTDDFPIRHINKNDDAILITANNPLMWLMEETNGSENTE